MPKPCNSAQLLVFRNCRFFEGVCKGRMEKQETENWNGHGNGRRKRIYPSNYHIASSVASCTDTYVFNLTLAAHGKAGLGHGHGHGHGHGYLHMHDGGTRLLDVPILPLLV